MRRDQRRLAKTLPGCQGERSVVSGGSVPTGRKSTASVASDAVAGRWLARPVMLAEGHRPRRLSDPLDLAA